MTAVNIYRSRTTINQTLTGSDRRQRGVSVDR
jgi:hypothetical protein